MLPALDELFWSQGLVLPPCMGCTGKLQFFRRLHCPRARRGPLITTTVGNYPKIGFGQGVTNLRTAITQSDQGKISRDDVQRVQEEVTRAAIKAQVEAGIDLVTDGQIRWDDGQTYFAKDIDGFTINGLIRYFDTNTYYRQPVAEGPLTWRGPIAVADFQFAVANSTRPVKPIIPGPYTLAHLSRTEHHRDFSFMVLELAEVLNAEAHELEKTGATIIQFDEPAILKHKEDIPLFKEAMECLTRGLHSSLALYTYFGDISGLYPHLFELPFQVIGLDFVMGPANWDIVREVPQDVSLALGVIDARNTKMETVEEIVTAVRRAKRIVSTSRMYLNPNCGLEFLPGEAAYQKLVRLAEGAKKAQEVLA